MSALELAPDRVSILVNLSGTQLKLKKFEDAERYSLLAISLDESSTEAWLNLGNARNELKRHDDALEAFDRAILLDPNDARPILNKGIALAELKQNDAALLAYEWVLNISPDHATALFCKSQVLEMLGRFEAASEAREKAIARSAAASPVFLGQRKKSQKANILVLNDTPVVGDAFETVGNFPSQLPHFFEDDFHFSYVYAGGDSVPRSYLQLQPPHLVLNNYANGEGVLSHGHLARLTELADSFGVPVINHPGKVVLTTRDVSIERIAGVPNVIVPKTTRFCSVGKTHQEMVREIETQFDYPVITRSLIAQEAKGMNKVDNREALLAVFASWYPENFFVTAYVDSRGSRKLSRKIRAAVVGDEMVILRVDFSPEWKVVGRKTDAEIALHFEHPQLRVEEQRICADPEDQLGHRAIQSLKTIRGRIPLDIFGIDFDVMQDGKLVFYEANATMNLFSTAKNVEVDYPKEAQDRLKAVFLSYFTSLLAKH